jgi:hypothetical protein
LNADGGTCGIGLAAYAPSAAFVMASIAAGSKPRTFRLLESVVAPSYS